MTAFLPQVLNFTIQSKVWHPAELEVLCKCCDWRSEWYAVPAASLGNIVDDAVAHYDENHR